MQINRNAKPGFKIQIKFGFFLEKLSLLFLGFSTIPAKEVFYKNGVLLIVNNC